MALALACKSFLLQKAYSKGACHEVPQPLQFTPMWNLLLNTCWPRPHLSWRHANLAILKSEKKGKLEIWQLLTPKWLRRKTSKTTPPPIWQVRKFVIQCNYQSVLTSFSWSKDNSIKSWHRISWKTNQFQFLHTKKRELLWWSRTSSDKVAIVSQAQIWFKRWLLNTLYNPNYVLLINSQSKHQ